MADRVISYDFKARIEGLVGPLAVAGKSVSAFGGKLTALDAQGVKMRAGLSTIGGAAGKMGLVATAGLAAVVAVTARFESAMSQVSAATNATGKDLESLRDAAVDAGASTVFSATEAAQGITELGKAGLSTADILSGGLAGALDLAAAGQISVAEAAATTAITLQQYGLAGDQATRVADTLAASAGKALGSVSDMGEALKYVGPVASQMGVSLEETSGAIALLAAQGVLGSQAGTALRGMLSSLTSPSKLAAKEMEKLGINMYDAKGEFIGLDGLAGQLQTTLGGLSNAERDAALGRLFGNEQITAARILYAGGASEVQKWTGLVTDSGYAAEQAGKLTDNLVGDLEELGGAFETALIGSGEGSTGILREMVQSVTGLTNAFNDLSPAAKNAASGLLAVTAVVGGALWFGSKVIGGIASTRLALQQLGVTATQTKALLSGIGRGLQFAAIGLTVDYLTDKIEELANANIEGDLSRNLAALADGRIVGNMEVLGNALDDFVNRSRAWSEVSTLMPFTSTEWEKGRDKIQEVDEALAAMVESGNAEMAALAFEQIAAMGAESGVSAEEAAAAFDQYAIALDNLAVAESNTATGGMWGSWYREADAADAAAAATGGLTDAQKKAIRVSKEQAEALEEVRKAAGETAASFVNLTEGVKGNKATLSGWIKEMADQADALRNFTLNAVEAGEKGVNQGLISHLRELGPEGAKQLRWLANASEKEIARANAAWGRIVDATNNYKDAVSGVPALNVKIQDAEGRKRIAEIQRLVDKFGMTKAEARAFIRDAATDKAKAIQRLVDKFGATKAEATALLRDMATGDIAAVRRALRDLNGDEAVVTIRTNHIVDRSGMRGMGGPTTESAMGDIFNGHQPQIARGGHTRIWAEPETGGEAYIPLRNDHRRPRAKSIAEETVGLLGGQVSWFARGGINAGLVGSTHASRYDDPTVSLRRASEDTARSVRRVNDNLGPLGENFQISTNIIQGNVRELKASIREMAKQTEMLKKIRDAERDQLKDLKDQRKSLADATAANFKPDAFGQIDLAAAAMNGQFGTAFGDQALAFANRGVDPAEQVQMFKDLSQEQIAAYLATLTATQRAEMENDVRFDALNNQMLDAAHFTEALEQAVANGLDGALFQQLATSGNVGAAQLFAGFTAEQIASYEQQFNNANLQATNAGQFAGQAEFGAAIRAQTLVTQEANQIAREALQTQRRNEKRLERLESILEKAPRDTGREVGKALDDVASGGRRRP